VGRKEQQQGMATQTAEVLGRLRLPPQELQRQRQLWTFSWSGIIIVIAVAVLFVLLSALQQSVSDLATVSATGQWATFFSLDFLTLTVPYLLATTMTLQIVRYLYDRPRMNQQEAVVLAVREAAALGDDRIAPLASDQLDSLLSDPLPALPAQLGPLRPPTHSQVEFYSTLAIIIGVFGISGVALGLVAGSANSFHEAGLWWGCALVSLPLLPLCIWAARRSHQLARPLTVTADEWGLQWKQSGRASGRAVIPWHEVRSLSQFQLGSIQPSGKYAFAQYTFVVDGGSAVLAWYVQTGMPAAELQASDDLTHLLFTRTRLPLRDITAAASALADNTSSAKYRHLMIQLMANSAAYPPNHYLSKLHTPTPARRLWWMVALALVPALCIPLCWVAAQVIQHH
jgi:hypothetical protein